MILLQLRDMNLANYVLINFNERKRREEEEREREREREKERERERERERQREREREREEKAEEEARNRLSSLLSSIQNKIGYININDFEINTSKINRKGISLQRQRVSNLYCSMNEVGSAYSESIDTSLKREKVSEQKNNYLYKETEELNLENLKALNTKKEKIRFTKKF